MGCIKRKTAVAKSGVVGIAVITICRGREVDEDIAKTHIIPSVSRKPWTARVIPRCLSVSFRSNVFRFELLAIKKSVGRLHHGVEPCSWSVGDKSVA